MVITYHGKESFKVQVGDTTLAFNPVSKDSKGKVSRYGADVALSSVNHPDYNGIDEVRYGEKVPFDIQSPGEYEAKGVFIKGIGVSSKIGKDEYVNTIYTLTFDGLKLCFLGVLSEKLSAEVKEGIGETDILFLPVSNGEVFGPRDAQATAVALEPKLIIPMNYDEKTLPLFLKEAGVQKMAPVEKMTIKKKDIEGKDGEVVLLEEI